MIFSIQLYRRCSSTRPITFPEHGEGTNMHLQGDEQFIGLEVWMTVWVRKANAMGPFFIQDKDVTIRPKCAAKVSKNIRTHVLSNQKNR